MTPLKLVLRNFIGIRDGLGIDEITLDLRPWGEGLIALVGENGAGKSTILDNLHPYRVMPSRAGGYSPDQFSYYDNTTGEALKELLWEHGGHTYRSSIVIKGTGKTKRTEAYLHLLLQQGGDAAFDLPNAWGPVMLPDGMSSDGKTKTYDACVEHILGTPTAYFTSVFSAQGRRPLAEYGNADIKALMSDLLGLEELADLHDRAGEVLRDLRAAGAGMASRSRELDEAADRHRAHETTISVYRTQVDEAEATVPALDQAAAAAREASADLLRQHRAQEDVARQREALFSQIRELETDFQTTRKHLLDSLEDERQRAKLAEADFQRRDLDLSQRINAAVTRASGLERFLVQAPQVSQAASSLPALADALEAAEVLSRERDEKLQGAVRLRERGESLATATEAASREAELLGKRVQELELRGRLVSEVPCYGMALAKDCRLLQDAHEAREGIADARERHQAALRAHATAQGAVEDARAQYAALQEEIKALGPLVDVGAARKRLEEARKLADLQPRIDEAREELERCSEERQALEAARAVGREEHDNAAAGAAHRIEALEGRLSDVTRVDAERQERIRDQIAALPQPPAASALAAAEQAQAAAEHALLTKLDGIQALRAEIARTEGLRDALVEQLADRDRLSVRLAALQDEIAHWTVLRQALGNDGIVALSIDDAGPALAGLTNDLLMSCFGPRFSVAIQTQRETQAGNLKETFDIVVHDAEAEDAKSVRAMSGGQRVYINEALTRAIALYQSQATGQRYGTLFADESDGALDVERKREFVAMKRRVLELGGYEREIFITHTPELLDLVDRVVDVRSLN